MNMSIIGTGRMGQALVRLLSQTIPDIRWGSRTPERAGRMAASMGTTALPVNTEEALEADIVLPALWHRDQLTWLPLHREALRGKIVVNITNPFNDTFDDFTTAPGSSSAEELQTLVPEARFVGAFKNTFWDVFARPYSGGAVSDVLVTSDDEEAKQAVIRQLQGIPFRILDGGALRNNRTIERMTLLSRELSVRYGHYPRVSWRLWGGDE